MGVLVGGLPAEQAQAALLETDGLFPATGPERELLPPLADAADQPSAGPRRLPFDWITDDHVYAGWLSRYRVVVVPGAWVLPGERTHRALVESTMRDRAAR